MIENAVRNGFVDHMLDANLLFSQSAKGASFKDGG